MTAAKGPAGLDLVLAAAVATVMIAHQVAAKTARDSLFLTWFDVTALPLMMIAGAIASAAAVLLMARVLARRGPARLIPPFYAVSGLIFALEWVAMAWQPRVVTVLLYLHISVLGSILISGFWSVINERYDPYRAKQVIARLAAASTLGGLVGGLAASAVASIADARGILLMLALMHLFCGVALTVVARGARQEVGATQPRGDSLLEPLKRSPLIRRMSLLVLLVATNAALLDYLLKSNAAAAFTEEELVHFFSSFYVAVGLGGFLLQTFVGRRALSWLGLGGTMAVLPVVVLSGGLFAFVVRQLATVAVLRAGAAMLNNSFFRAGFETLYTPIPAADKRSGKLLIDVGADRAGDLVGSLMIMGILLFPRVAEDLLLAAVVAVALLCLVLILYLQRGYVAQLADNLRDGTLRAEDITAADATTRQTVALTQTAISREALLSEIERSRAVAASAETAPSGQMPTPASTDPVVWAVGELRSGDPERIRRALLGRSLAAELLPFVIPLLARDDVLRDLFQALRPVASRASGQLVDALLDRRLHPLVRRRIPLVLARADNPRAVSGLVECLEDDDPDVRLRCGEALHRMIVDHPHLPVPSGDLWNAVRAELGRLRSNRPPGPGGDVPHHLFRLLGILHDPESLDLCYRSLTSGDRAMGGTALEYLENLLPEDVRAELWPLIAGGGQTTGPKRPLQDIARDLLKAASLSHRSARKPAADDPETTSDTDRGGR